jgi:hypothetical protein
MRINRGLAQARQSSAETVRADAPPQRTRCCSRMSVITRPNSRQAACERGREADNERALIVTLVLTLMIGGQQYERNMPTKSVTECLSQAARVLNEAARIHEKDETPEIGAGCVIGLNPVNPA